MDGISVALLRPLAEVLGRLGEDAAGFLAGLGVDDALAPNAYIDAARVDAAIAAIAARRGDPAFALTLARASAARPLGLFGHMVWLSGTVRDALERAVKFYGVVTQRTTLVLGPSTISQHPRRGGAVRGRILTEFPFASLALRTREATNGAFALRAVRFAHAGEATPAYRELFGAPVAFGAARDELEFDPAQLDLRLASADPLTSAVLEAKVVQLTRAPEDALVARVRAAIAGELAAGEAALALAAVAKRLAMSARTLRRHLEQHGCTLRELVDDVRRERADELLAAGTSIKEVAFALGFSEPSAFSRAYKRWTGAAPGNRVT